MVRTIRERILYATRRQMLICGSITAAIILFLIILISVVASNSSDLYSGEWNITREMWNARWANNTLTTEQYEPVRLVVIQHTISRECFTFSACRRELRSLQRFFLNNFGYDIPYNFVIGNDGRVYEGRGLGLVAAHTFGYNSCTIGIGFIGDYRGELPNHTQVTELQVENFHRLLDEAVKRNFLHPNYHIVGARDITSTASPGSNLYDEMQTWPHYDHDGLYRGRTCDEIHAMFED